MDKKNYVVAKGVSFIGGKSILKKAIRLMKLYLVKKKLLTN